MAVRTEAVTGWSTVYAETRDAVAYWLPQVINAYAPHDWKTIQYLGGTTHVSPHLSRAPLLDLHSEGIPTTQ